MRNIDDPGFEVELLAESYRIKMVEKIQLLPRAAREAALKEADYSIVHLNSEAVFIDLITDSGTGAMSDQQWAALMRGDEAYMRSVSFNRFRKTVHEITGYDEQKSPEKGYPHVVPTHQGRAAEHILFGQLVNVEKPGEERKTVVLSNTHFDTTRAHVEHRGGKPLDLVADAVWDFDKEHPFKGNYDLARLEAALERYRGKIAFVMITVVNNFACSSPVSMENIRETSKLARKWGLPVYFDACRFAENAYFIKTREKGYQDKSIQEIVHEMFSYGDGCWMSAKKDGIVNIGGFIALRDKELWRRCHEALVLFEGFPSYGGLAGRDLEAMAVGLKEGTDEHYLADRIEQGAYLSRRLEEVGIKTSKPSGGSGVFIDVGALYGHLPAEKFPAIALTCDLYLEGGIRAGAYPFQFTTLDPKTGETHEKTFQFARLAIPRRTYTKGHLDYIVKVMAQVKERARHNKGYRITYSPKVLPNFFSKFAPLE